MDSGNMHAPLYDTPILAETCGVTVSQIGKPARRGTLRLDKAREKVPGGGARPAWPSGSSYPVLEVHATVEPFEDKQVSASGFCGRASRGATQVRVEMQRDPHRILAGEGDTMPLMGLYQQAVPRAKIERTIRKLQSRGTLDQCHPFVPVLIIPKPVRAGDSVRNDVLQTESATR